MHSDPEHTFFLFRWAGELVATVIVILLALLTYLGKRNQAQIASAVIQEKPISQAQLIECQLKLTETMTAGFDSLRRELMNEFRNEVSIIHKRINNHERSCDKLVGKG